jgi:signal transduction histidine kinase/ActR/RegA family two-component response regulator
MLVPGLIALAVAAGMCHSGYRADERAAVDGLAEFGRSLAREIARSTAATLQREPAAVGGLLGEFVRDQPLVAEVAVRGPGGEPLVGGAGASPARSTDALTIEQPLVDPRTSAPLGTLELTVLRGPAQRVLRERLWLGLSWSGLLLFAIAAALWIELRRRVLRPLSWLDAAATRLADGRLEAPIEPCAGHALGPLGPTLERMRANLAASHGSLARQNDQLVELNGLKSQFLANMSHEMRTPLTSIQGGIELLLDGSANEVDRWQTAAMIQRNSEQLLELVDRVLDFAKLEAGNLIVDNRACRPATIVREACLGPQAQAAAKGVELRLDLDCLGDCTIATDPARLRQLTTTIVGNAVKFTDRGHIEVRARLFASEAGCVLRVEVADTGIGISEQHMPHLFETFRQADGSLTRRHGGLGLGLALARRIARRLGGDVTVTSEDGRGTLVVLTLAVQQAAAPPDPVAAGPAWHRAAGRGAHVLLADDAPDNQRLLRAILVKGGHTVTLAANGREAVEAVVGALGGPRFDLVVMDLQMPELDGISAIRRLREFGFDRPIVALTAHALADDRERCLAAGANAYETKPISPMRLLEVVAQHLQNATRGAHRTGG